MKGFLLARYFDIARLGPSVFTALRSQSEKSYVFSVLGETPSGFDALGPPTQGSSFLTTLG